MSGKELRVFELRVGDVLFNTRNSLELVGKVAIWPANKPGHVYNNNLLRLRFGPGVDATYIGRQMQAPAFRAHLETLKSATTSVAAIYQKSLMDAPVRLPPLTEQRAIVRRIEAAFAALDRAAAEVQAARARLERLDRAVLAKAFRGELVPQDPADEPASALLARLRAQRPAAKPKRGRRAAGEPG